eukprot:s309_g4.t2
MYTDIRSMGDVTVGPVLLLYGLKIFGKLQDSNAVNSIWQEVRANGWVNKFLATARIDSASEMGDIEGAASILDFMAHETVPVYEIHFNSAINACKNSNHSRRHEAALSLLDSMLSKGLQPNVVTFANLALAHHRQAPLDMLEDVLSRMRDSDIIPNKVFTETFVGALFQGRLRAVSTVEDVHTRLKGTSRDRLRVAQAVLRDARSRGATGELPGWRDEDEMAGAGFGAAVGPEYMQVPGEPFAFYHKVMFPDTKPTGIRMSACLNAMEECRTDSFTICDQRVASMRKVTNPFILVALELHPSMAEFHPDNAEDGLLYAHPGSGGPIMTWLRLEATWGWPMFPLRSEEQTIYAVGKNPRASKRTPIATGRFIEALVDEQTNAMLTPEKWQQDFDQFFDQLKQDHSNSRLNESRLPNLYMKSNKPFTPTLFKKVSWTMSCMFADLWAILFHALGSSRGFGNAVSY